MDLFNVSSSSSFFLYVKIQLDVLYCSLCGFNSPLRYRQTDLLLKLTYLPTYYYYYEWESDKQLRETRKPAYRVDEKKERDP